jgi:hypothetical protein
MKTLPALFVAALCLATAPRCFAPPPLVTGDVPTAPAESFELYVGMRYQDTGRIERQLPFTELVYGLTDRWEVIVEAPYLSRERAHGLGDVVLGTKYVLLQEDERRPGIAGSYEVKLDNAEPVRGLGSGGYEHDLRLRAQKTWGWFTPIVNAGYIVIPDADVRGADAPRLDA